MAAAVLGLMAAPPGAMARHRHVAAYQGPAWSPVAESITLDADTGQVFSESNADAPTYPASLTKMMTLYLTFQALHSGRLHLEQPLPVSAEAAAQRPSHLGLNPGDAIPVRDLILAIVTKSANDAAVILAEGMAGSEPAFAERMNQEARLLGMTRTYYHNASGLPDSEQHTTARDVARLALALYRDFPHEFHYFSTREFDFRGETLASHNHLLDWYQGADGIKTGFINASGYNIAVSAVRNGRRLFAVVMGGHSWRARDEEAAGLLDQDFAQLAGGPAAHPAAPHEVVAALQSAPAAAAAAAAASVAAPRAPVPARPDRIGRLAAAAMREPPTASRAEAAPRDPADWGIQLGTFHGQSAAVRAARHAGHLAGARGKPEVIVPPARHAHPPLYRARLAHFTERGAEAACATLHHRGLACTVVAPGAKRVASR